MLTYHNLTLVTLRELQVKEPTCIQLLNLMALQAFDRGTAELSIPDDVNEEVILPAIDAGIITAIEGRTCKLTPDNLTLLTSYALAAERLLPCQEEELTEAILRLRVLGRHLKDVTLTGLSLAILHNHHGIDVLTLVANQTSGGTQFPELYLGLCAALPFLDIDAERFLDCVMQVANGTVRDLMNGMLFNSVSTLCESRIDVANELYQYIVEYNLEAYRFIPAILCGTSSTDFRQAFALNIGLLDSTKLIKIRAGILGLGALLYGENDAELDIAVDRLESLSRTATSEIAPAIISSCGNLLDKSDRVTSILVQMSNIDDPETAYQLSVVLSRHVQTRKGNEWFKECILSLVTTHPKHRAIISNIDVTLSELLPHNQETVLEFLRLWITSSHDKSVDEWTELYQCTYSHLQSDFPHLIPTLVLAWFASNSRQLQSAASEIIKSLVQYDSILIEDLEFDAAEVSELDDVDAIFVAHKVIGYISDPRVLCSLIMSIGVGSKSAAVQSAVEDMLVDYVGYHYPAASVDYFDRCISGSSADTGKLAQSAKHRVEEYLTARRALPRLKEFEPPSVIAKNFYRASRIAIQKGIHDSRKDSPFLSLVRTMPLKGGKAWTVEHDGIPAQPSALHTVSHTFEMPRGLTIDPQGLEFLRLNYKLEQRKIDK